MLKKRIQALEQNFTFDSEMKTAYQNGIITPDEWNYYQTHKTQTAGIPKVVWPDSALSQYQRTLASIISKSGSIIVWRESFTR